MKEHLARIGELDRLAAELVNATIPKSAERQPRNDRSISRPSPIALAISASGSAAQGQPFGIFSVRQGPAVCHAQLPFPAPRS
jgi:hypothetical protein